LLPVSNVAMAVEASIIVAARSSILAAPRLPRVPTRAIAAGVCGDDLYNCFKRQRDQCGALPVNYPVGTRTQPRSASSRTRQKLFIPCRPGRTHGHAPGPAARSASRRFDESGAAPAWTSSKPPLTDATIQTRLPLPSHHHQPLNRGWPSSAGSWFCRHPPPNPSRSRSIYTYMTQLSPSIPRSIHKYTHTAA
jgi:hypothetical protein